MIDQIRIGVFIASIAAMTFGLVFTIVDAADKPTAVENATTNGSTRLALPAELCAVTGIECNVYFDNVFLALNPENYAFDVTCSKGRQQAERWTWMPTDVETGEYPFQLEVRDDQNRVVSRGNTTLKVVPITPDKKRNLSLLLVGDSLTHASVYSQHLLDLSSKFGQPALTLVGSHGIGPTLGANRHEGYGVGRHHGLPHTLARSRVRATIRNEAAPFSTSATTAQPNSIFGDIATM